ncbi:hypothetical protein [Ilumatobacter sp.]|uniref:hypothetical protein n=1 Tax=Ilumatobacter sp. TaxID=1967498 RepID=UPI003AF45500
MSDPLPPAPPDDDRFAAPQRFTPPDELLARFLRLVVAMIALAIVLAVLPLPSFVHVLVLLVLPVFVLISAIEYHDAGRSMFIRRHTRKLWEFRRDRATVFEASGRAAEPISAGLRRAWLLLGLFAAVFLIGLVLAALSAGVSERLYG